MIVPDLNILLYSHFDGFPEHARARAWWEATLSGHEPVGLVGPVVFGFVRLATNRRVFATPMDLSTATSHVEGWLCRPNVEYLADSERVLQIALDLLRDAETAANLTTDAQIAAHAIAVRGAVYSHDTDFARFPKVVWIDPILADPG